MAKKNNNANGQNKCQPKEARKMSGQLPRA